MYGRSLDAGLAAPVSVEFVLAGTGLPPQARICLMGCAMCARLCTLAALSGCEAVPPSSMGPWNCVSQVVFKVVGGYSREGYLHRTVYDRVQFR
jgi:hypothetical protein